MSFFVFKSPFIDLLLKVSLKMLFFVFRSPFTDVLLRVSLTMSFFVYKSPFTDLTSNDIFNKTLQTKSVSSDLKAKTTLNF